MGGTAVFKILIAVGLSVNALNQTFSNQTWWFIQNVNLIFHEAGHVFFMFFGDFMSILGGSLLEILIPLTITLYFALKRQFFSAACTSWWLSTAFLSVSIYAADAGERAIPLITKDISTHDWFNMLVQLNLLRYDDLIGFLFWCGSILSVILILFFLTKDKDIKPLLHRHTLG